MACKIMTYPSTVRHWGSNKTCVKELTTKVVSFPPPPCTRTEQPLREELGFCK